MQLSGTHVSVYSTVIKVLALHSLYSNCKALKLPCDSNNVLEVTEGASNNSVTCIGLNQTNTVEWLIDSANFGSCSVPTNGQNTCIMKALTPVFVLSRKEITESVMIINATSPSRNGVIENRTMQCQVLSQSSNVCTMDLILPAEGSCLAKFIRRDSVPWGVSTDCNITKVYSSLGRYKCEIYSVLSNTETSIFTDNSPALSSAGGKYYSFSCVFTGNMPTDEGLYNYKAIITPGRKIITATSIESLEILRPTKSAVRCSPSPDVPENTNVTCTCNTTNIGKPGGRLKWYRGNNQIGTGEYDDSTLVMSQTLYRSDNGVIQFRCDVDWTSVTSGDSFTISVGYIDQSVIKVNNLPNLSVAENQAVTFNCNAIGRPTPSMSLVNKGNGTIIRTDTSPLTHTVPSARCEDTATYSCLASNGMGKDTTSTANLYVNCKPRLHSDAVVPDTLHPMKYNGQAVTQIFTIIAYPTPSNFSFLFWGTGACTCKSAVINIVLNMTCTNLQTLFMSTCTLSVDNMTNSDSAGVYSVTLTNAHGSVDLKFQVDVDGTSESETTSAGFAQGVGVGVGVIVAVIAILALLIVFCLWRKKQKLTCIDKTMESHESPLTPLTSLNKDVSEIPIDTTLAKPPGLYDPLRQSEIGQVSQYSELSQYESISESSKPKESEGKSKGTPVSHVYHNTTVI